MAAEPAVGPSRSLISRELHPRGRAGQLGLVAARLSAVMSDCGELPLLVVDGDLFDDYAGFAREFTKLLCHYEWLVNLDAFHEAEDGIVLELL